MELRTKNGSKGTIHPRSSESQISARGKEMNVLYWGDLSHSINMISAVLHLGTRFSARW